LPHGPASAERGEALRAKEDWTMTMAKPTILGLGLAVAVLAAPAAAPAQTSGSGMSRDDVQFVDKAARDGLAEVDLGRVAQQRATGDAVRGFGARMVEDHSRANEELRVIVQRKGHMMPHAVDQQHGALRDRLTGLSGHEFDRVYMSEMVRDHEAAVRDFERQARTGDDADVKAWAAKTLPALREHLRLAQDISTRLAGGPSTAPAASVVTAGSMTATPWCGGAWRPGAGTNFGPCPK
jgi:putative membrane protein